MNTLNDLFENQIKMLYSVEDQLIGGLQKMTDQAADEALKSAFADHLKETKEHKKRLDQVGEELGYDISTKKCKTAEALIRETEDFLSCDPSDAVKDAGLVAHAQQVEHHEIAGYGTVCSYAEELGYEGLYMKLKKTLDEEKSADDKLGDLAVRLNSSVDKKKIAN